MHHLTKGVLRRPVTVVITLIALVVFAITAFTTVSLQLTPDISIPYMIIYTVYPGADPVEEDELVATVIEEAASTVTGVKMTQTRSSENMSYVILQFEYGTDMDQAYDDVKKAGVGEDSEVDDREDEKNTVACGC